MSGYGEPYDKRRRSRSRDRDRGRDRDRDRDRGRDREGDRDRDRDRGRRDRDDSPDRKPKRQSFFDKDEHGDKVSAGAMPEQAAFVAGSFKEKLIKQRELYIGGYPSTTTAEEIRQLFDTLYKALPEFQQKYPHLKLTSTVKNIKVATPAGSAMGTAYVEMESEELAITGLKFQNIQFNSKPLAIGRAQGATGYTVHHLAPRPTDKEAPGLDVTPLQQLWLLPPPIASPVSTGPAGPISLPGDFGGAVAGKVLLYVTTTPGFTPQITLERSKLADITPKFFAN